MPLFRRTPDVPLLMRFRHSVTYVSVCVLLLMLPKAGQGDVFKLSNLTHQQQTELFYQADAYGLLSAFLNYCQRPPRLVQRLASIAQGCVEEFSFAAVRDRYTTAAVQNSGAYNCSGPELVSKVLEFERKIDSLIASFQTACRLRVFYNLSFPKIDLSQPLPARPR